MRRRVISVLMVLGSAGLVTAVASLALSFGDEDRRRAAFALALDFATWRTLTARLSDADAATVMTRMVA